MFHGDVVTQAEQNDNFRKVIDTGTKSQLVLMSIPVGGDIGEETHPDTDQILFLVQGNAEAVLNDEVSSFEPGDAVFVKAGTKHNFINRGETALKLYTVYAPPEHREGTIHKTKQDAQTDSEDHYK